jgi:hypothetical protein
LQRLELGGLCVMRFGRPNHPLLARWCLWWRIEELQFITWSAPRTYKRFWQNAPTHFATLGYFS